MLLSLRNTFRRKGRLALTLSTLTIAGVIFMAVMSVRASLNLTLNDIFAYYDYDVRVTLNRPYRTTVLDDALRVPGVVGIEYWSTYSAQRLLADDLESTNSFGILSMPAQTEVFNPKMRDGRWLLPQDAAAVVVNTEFLKKEPDVKLGDEIRVKVAGKTTTLQVVGIADILFDQPSVYVNQPYFSRVVGEVGKASQAQVLTERHDGAFQAQVAKMLEERFKRQGLELAGTLTNAQQRINSSQGINIIVVFLLIMAILLAVVGGLGLMGTMSINVLERTREIGVMRAIGATDQLAGAKAQLASAQATLSKLRGPQHEQQLAVAQAGVDAAQANLARVHAGPLASEVLAAQAQVDSAQAAVTTARFDLAQTELRAPFAGVVAALDLKLHEYVNGGAALIQLADTTAWQVETTDLTELSAVRVRAGDTVKLTFDAIPDLVLSGKVERIKGYGENRQGDIVYKVVVQPDTEAASLRWNMTASISITGR